MVTDILGDEDVIEVLDVTGWRSTYAVQTGEPIPIPNPIPVQLDFDDDEPTKIRPPAVHLLSGEPILGE